MAETVEITVNEQTEQIAITVQSGQTTDAGDLSSGTLNVSRLGDGSIDEVKLDASVNASLDLADSAVQPNTSPVLDATNFTNLPDGESVSISVRNTTGATVLHGQPVYISGAQGTNLPLISLAQANNITTSRCIGLATNDIPNNTNGFVTSVGIVEELDTSSFTAGDTLFISTTTAGGLTNVRPTTGFAVVVGFVTISNPSNGEIKVLPGLTVQESNIVNTSAVTNAGALMDSEVANLAQVKAFDSTDYATQSSQDTQDIAIALNTAKTGITTTQANDITANNAKISFDSGSSTRLANTSGTNTGDQTDISDFTTGLLADARVQESNVSQHLDYVTPEQFGAVGDGTTDDRAALNAALATKPKILKGDPTKTYRITAQINAGDFGSMKFEDLNIEIDYAAFASQGVFVGNFTTFTIQNCNFTTGTAANVYTHFYFEDGDNVFVNNSKFVGAQNSFIETTRVRYKTRYTNSWFEDSTTHGISQVENTFVPYESIVDNCYFQDIKIYGADIHSIHGSIINSTYKNVSSVGKSQRKQSNALAQDPDEKTTFTLRNIAFEYDYETALHDILTTANVAAFGAGTDIIDISGIKANIVQPPVVSNGDMRFFTVDSPNAKIYNNQIKVTTGTTPTLPTEMVYLPVDTESIEIINNNFDLDGLRYNLIWGANTRVHKRINFSSNHVKIGAVETTFPKTNIIWDQINDIENLNVTSNVIIKDALNTKPMHFLELPTATVDVTNLTVSDNIVFGSQTPVYTGVVNLKRVNNIGIDNDASGGTGDVSKVGTPVNNQIGVWTGDGDLEGDTDFVWTGTRLGVGTNDPRNPIHILSSGTTSVTTGVERGFLVSDQFGPRLLLEQTTEGTNQKLLVLRYELEKFSFNAINDAGTSWINENLWTLDRSGNTTQKGSSVATDYKVSSLNTAPASATATGTTGEIRVTATHIYVCTATNTWVRTALTTW